MTGKLLLMYEDEWEIATPPMPNILKTIRTPLFFPLKGNGVTFFFEAFYQCVCNPNSSSSDLALFKLKLVKHSSTEISPTLELTIDVKVNYSRGLVFKEYETQSYINARQMKEIAFPDEVREMHTRNFGTSDHAKCMAEGTLKIKCKMTFDDSEIPLFKLDHETSYVALMKNYKSVFNPSVLSDFVFNIGDKSLPAHKVVLAAHSPVFMKMMTDDFLESKANSVIITDATPKVFDQFLKFLYSGEIEDSSWPTFRDLYYLADKYDVEVLKKECTKGAILHLSVESVCEILEVAYKYSDSNLKSAAIQFAVSKIKELVSGENWKKLITNHPNIGYEVAVNFFPK